MEFPPELKLKKVTPCELERLEQWLEYNRPRLAGDPRQQRKEAATRHAIRDEAITLLRVPKDDFAHWCINAVHAEEVNDLPGIERFCFGDLLFDQRFNTAADRVHMAASIATWRVRCYALLADRERRAAQLRRLLKKRARRAAARLRYNSRSETTPASGGKNMDDEIQIDLEWLPTPEQFDELEHQDALRGRTRQPTRHDAVHEAILAPPRNVPPTELELLDHLIAERPKPAAGDFTLGCAEAVTRATIRRTARQILSRSTGDAFAYELASHSHRAAVIRAEIGGQVVAERHMARGVAPWEPDGRVFVAFAIAEALADAELDRALRRQPALRPSQN